MGVKVEEKDGKNINRVTSKVVDKATQSGRKPRKIKRRRKISQNSKKVHGKKDQGMVKYGTPPEEVHPEAQK